MKKYTNLKREIYTEEMQSQKNTTIVIFILMVAILGTSIIALSHFYGEANKAELINLREMNQ